MSWNHALRALALGALSRLATAAPQDDLPDPRTFYDAVDYRIELFVDPQGQTIRGFGATAGVVTADRLDEVVLDLEHHLVVTSAARLEGDFFRNVPSAMAPAPFQFGEDRVRVKLDRPYLKGERFQVAVYYTGKPIKVDEFTGFHFSTTPVGHQPWIATSCQTIGEQTWWPCKSCFYHPEDKPERVAINVTVPEPLVAASNGRLLDVEKNAGLTTWRWRMDLPLPTYSVALAIGPYKVIESSVKLDGLEQELPLRYFVLPEHEELARKEFAQVPELLRFYTEKFGPFPYASMKYGLAETPFWGMEHSTVIAYGNSFPDAIRGSGQVDPFELRNKLYDYILVHESAHEWWGNAVSAATWADFWLHEGFATYAEALWVEHAHGLEAALEFMHDKKPGVPPLATVMRPRHASAGEAYDTSMYDKGAWVLHMLRYVMGDSKFFAALKEFNTDPRFRYHNASTVDFEAVCEKHHGASLRPFFQAWIYGTRWPNYVVHAPKLEGNKATVSIECKSVSQFPFEMPLDVEIHCTDGTTQKQRVPLVKGINSLALEAKSPIKSVDFPGFRWILCDLRLVP